MQYLHNSVVTHLLVNNLPAAKIAAVSAHIGDARRKGAKLEPYSYIKLDPKNMNKRRKHLGVKAFSGVGKGSRKKRR